jgi:hypothetical protein
MGSAEFEQKRNVSVRQAEPFVPPDATFVLP